MIVEKVLESYHVRTRILSCVLSPHGNEIPGVVIQAQNNVGFHSQMIRWIFTEHLTSFTVVNMSPESDDEIISWYGFFMKAQCRKI
jgi:hypothetical protein